MRALTISNLLLGSQLFFVTSFGKFSSTTSSKTGSSSKTSSTSTSSFITCPACPTSACTSTTSTSSPLNCPTGTTQYTTNEVLGFDDIQVSPVNTGTGTNVPNGYGGLSFQAFPVSNVSLAIVGVVPHSPPNFIVTGSVVETTEGIPMISVNYPNSQTSSFDMNSMYLGCILSADNSLAGPPQACVISMTGFTGSDNSISNNNFACAYTVLYNPSTNVGLQQMTYSGQFPASCKGITFMIFEFNIFPATLNTAQERLGLAVDSINVTVRGCNSTTS